MNTSRVIQTEYIKSGANCEYIKSGANCEYIKSGANCEYINRGANCEYIKSGANCEYFFFFVVSNVGQNSGGQDMKQERPKYRPDMAKG